jgi:hypothetical protein
MMLQLRTEQMEVFRQAAVQNFEDRMVKHLKEYFTKPCDALGEAEIRRIIHFALEQIRSYGMMSEGSVNLYLDLMFMLGRSFDKDPQLPWAAEILNDESIVDETSRLDLLYDKAADFVERVAGDRNEHVFKAMRRILQEPIAPPPLTDLPEFYGYIVGWLGKLFPEKHLYIGELSTRRLTHRGLGAARSYGLTSGRGVTIYIGLMFMLGSGFDTDPQYSWAATVLKDDTSADGCEKAERLYAEAIARIQEWLPDAG